MDNPLATIVVIPRERFSAIERCLESIYRYTPPPFSLICVDGNYPRALAQRLQLLSRIHNFQLIPSPSFLSYSQSRRLALSLISTPYTCFVDNDVIVTPNWLEKMLVCAQETGAGIVTPLILEGEINKGLIHAGGGIAVVQKNEEGNYLYAFQYNYHKKVYEIQPALKRELCTLAEPHSFLIRTELLDSIIDEKILCCTDYVDISLSVTGMGYFEPESVVSYLDPPPFLPIDLPFYRYTWSNEAVNLTLNRYQEKYNLSQNDPWLHQKKLWMHSHLKLSFHPDNILLEEV